MKELLKFVVIIFICCLFVFSSYKMGRHDGFGEGIDATLDTVVKVMDAQVRSDTSVTKLVLIRPDTSTFILSRKTVLQK